MKLLTLARDLQRRKARERQQQFVAEGVRTVETLLDSPLEITGLLVTHAARLDGRSAVAVTTAEARQIPVLEVSEAELASAADTETPQGVLAIARIPVRRFAPPTGPARYLVLDALQDPGNVGTVIRTAAAMGVTATLALPGTVDLWNAKVVRGSMGALFTHQAFGVSFEALHGLLEQDGVALWAADLEGDPLPQVAASPLPERLAVVVSNEGAGLSPPLSASVARQVRIPMAPGVESLNVAVATAIMLYALRDPAAR